MSSKVYMVVTEDWYGGEEQTRVYSDEGKAIEAARAIIERTKERLDVSIFEKDLKDDTHHRHVKFGL